MYVGSYTIRELLTMDKGREFYGVWNLISLRYVVKMKEFRYTKDY